MLASLSLLKVSLLTTLAAPSAPATLVTAVPTAGDIGALRHASFGHPVALSGIGSGFSDLKHSRGLKTMRILKKRCSQADGEEETPIAPATPVNNVSTPSESSPLPISSTTPDIVEDSEEAAPEPEPSTTAQNDIPESIPDVLSTLIGQLNPVLEELGALILNKDKDDVNVDEVTHSLQSVELLLEGAADKIKSIVKLGGLNASLTLKLNGEKITVFDLAKLVATLLDTLFGVLSLVIRVVGSLNIPIVSALLGLIGDVVADLVTTVLGIIPGLKTVLGPLLEGVINLLKVFDFPSVNRAIAL